MTGYCPISSPCSCNTNTNPTSGFCFDSKTGNISFLPMDCYEFGLIVIKAEQWRKKATNQQWQYIGFVKREVRVQNIQCPPNNPPKILLDNDTAFSFCPNIENCYEIEAHDFETISQAWKDTIDLSWTSVLPGATFTPDTPRFIFDNGQTISVRKGKLCWNPQQSDVRQIPYLVTFTARDRACPYNSLTSKTIRVFVNPKDTLRFNHKIQNSLCGKDTRMEVEITTSSFNIANYSVQTRIAPLLAPDSAILNFDSAVSFFRVPQTGSYIITTSLLNKISKSPCAITKSDTVLLFHTDSLLLNHNASIFLNADSLQCFENNRFSFLDSSVELHSSIVNRAWYIGTDSFSNQKDPSNFRFAKSGNFTVYQKVTYDNGCILNSNPLQIAIEKTTANLIPSLTQSQCFRNHSFRLGHNANSTFGATQIAWHATDSIFSSDSVFAPQFPSHGSKTVTLIAVSDNGCRDTATQRLNIWAQPVSDFTVLPDTQVCFLDTFFMQNNSQIASGTIATSQWRFGDGTSSSQADPFKRYLALGSYQVLLISISDSACRDTTIQNLRVNARPTVQILPFNNSQCFAGNQFHLKNNKSIATGSTIDSLRWHFSDTTVYSQDSLFKSFANPGMYSVTLTAYSDKGCQNKASTNLSVKPNPKADFNILPDSVICLRDTFFLQNNSSISAGHIFQFAWGFSDSTSSLDSSTNKVFNRFGMHQIGLAVLSDSGCVDTLRKQVIVNAIPTLNLQANNTSQCFPGHNFILNANATIAQGSIDSLRWFFGDGTSSTQNNPNKTYIDTGNYRVLVKAYSDQGCIDTGIIMLTALDKVLANFTVNQDTQCLRNNFFVFTDNSSVITTSNKKWDYGDSSTATSIHGNRSYAQEGSYEVSLITNYTEQCADTFKITITIHPSPTADSIRALSISAHNGNDTFSYKTQSQIGHSYQWNVSGGSILGGQGSDSIWVRWNDSGFQMISYVISNIEGCKDTAYFQQYVDHAASIHNIDWSNTKIYPNPVSRFLHIESTHTIASIQVYDNKGAIVIQSGSSHTIDFSGLATGLYIVKLTDMHGKVMSGKVVKE